MANHQDAVKRHKQSIRRRLRNRTNRTRMRNQVKVVRAAITAGKTAEAATEFNTAMSVLHTLAKKGVIHKNQAARKIARLAAAVKAIGKG